eukprot:TRINITY_DN2648_c0_g1_i2.p1 TRINITY_DN2648_c0_g1~~TRINITY_DN2648_c0_g1_i2.p1  ORF type:complete len:507 (+),score=200.80 TRINITY_DN2648_c0_g1_i2:61-1581(+)
MHRNNSQQRERSSSSSSSRQFNSEYSNQQLDLNDILDISPSMESHNNFISFHHDSNPIPSPSHSHRSDPHHSFDLNPKDPAVRRNTRSSYPNLLQQTQEVIDLSSPPRISKTKKVSSKDISKPFSLDHHNKNETNANGISAGLPPRTTRLSSTITKKPSSSSSSASLPQKLNSSDEGDELFRFNSTHRRNAEPQKEESPYRMNNNDGNNNIYPLFPPSKKKIASNGEKSYKKKQKSGKEVISISSAENSPEKMEGLDSSRVNREVEDVNMSLQSQADEELARSLQMELDNSSRFAQFHNLFDGSMMFSPMGMRHSLAEMSEDEKMALKLQRESYLGLDEPQRHHVARENDEADATLARLMQQEEEAGRRRFARSRSRSSEEEFLRGILRSAGLVRGRGRGGMMLGRGFLANQVDVDNMSYEDLLALSERIGDVKSKGAAQGLIEQLPVGTVINDGGTCSVCLEDMNVGESSRTLPCLHQYHVDCIDKWLKTNRHCPVCNRSINPDE